MIKAKDLIKEIQDRAKECKQGLDTEVCFASADDDDLEISSSYVVPKGYVGPNREGYKKNKKDYICFDVGEEDENCGCCS